MDLPRLHGIVPPAAHPAEPDGSIDEAALARLVEFQIGAGVHGLWVLGTTARFDLLPDDRQRRVAEVVAEVDRRAGPAGPQRLRHGDRPDPGPRRRCSTTCPTTITRSCRPGISR